MILVGIKTDKIQELGIKKTVFFKFFLRKYSLQLKTVKAYTGIIKNE